MAEYIEREEVLELMRSVSRDIEDVPENAFPKNYADGWEDGLETAADKVENIPAADARPERHGVWLVSGDCYECSECGGGSVVNANPYCWKCGAKMNRKVNNAE